LKRTLQNQTTPTTTHHHHHHHHQQQLKYMKTRNILLLAVSTALLAGLAPTAQAIDYKTYGACWAWNNDFNDPNHGISDSFDSGSYPGETISFNFGSQSLYGYPAVCRGWHYGTSETGDTLFPLQLSKANNIPCKFSYQSSGSGMQGDFAYDSFLRWDNSTSWQVNPQLEVMVWAGHNSFPIGNCTGNNVLNNNNISWDIWEGTNSYAGYYVYTFVPHGTVVWPINSLPTSGSMNVDLKPFYQWLNDNRSSSGLVNNNMYLDVVECGFEVVEGNGSCYFNGWIDANTGVNNGTYKIISRNSGKALEAPNQWTANGQQIDQYSYYGGASQQWQVSNTGSGNYKIIGVQSGRSLDIYRGNSSNGTKVELWDYNGGSNQQYKFAATDSGYYRITPNCATGSCLDVNGASTANSAPVILWQPNGGANQQWSFQAP
jgi:hypothetical protein